MYVASAKLIETLQDSLLDTRQERDAALATLLRVVNAANAHPEPIHYAVRAAVDAAREFLMETSVPVTR